MFKSTMFRTVASAIWGLFFCGQLVFAQVNTGTISGTVKDKTGAVMPGATVVIANEDTGISRTVQTDPSGRYLAPALSLGNYG